MHAEEIEMTYNWRLAKRLIQYFNEVLCFVSSSVQAGSLVLPMPIIGQLANTLFIRKKL